MTFYFNDQNHFVRSPENLIYRVYSYEINNNSNMIHLNLMLVGGRDGNMWLMAKDLPEEVQWETITQYFLTEGMYAALENSGYTMILELPEGLQEVISDYYSNGKYDEYRTRINELCCRFGYEGCDVCPLYVACCAKYAGEDPKHEQAMWERGIAEAYEGYMMENMEVLK